MNHDDNIDLWHDYIDPLTNDEDYDSDIWDVETEAAPKPVFATKSTTSRKTYYPLKGASTYTNSVKVNSQRLSTEDKESIMGLAVSQDRAVKALLTMRDEHYPVIATDEQYCGYCTNQNPDRPIEFPCKDYIDQNSIITSLVRNTNKALSSLNIDYELDDEPSPF